MRAASGRTIVSKQITNHWGLPRHSLIALEICQPLFDAGSNPLRICATVEGTALRLVRTVFCAIRYSRLSLGI
uniref:Transposase n=1 Tax=Steinernema glaseri TaxID=37863 RepID=A0A1I8ARR1_9BILA